MIISNLFGIGHLPVYLYFLNCFKVYIFINIITATIIIIIKTIKQYVKKEIFILLNKLWQVITFKNF